MADAADKPLTLAVLVATPTPYFTHFYTRIARELEEVRPVVHYTHLRPGWPVPPTVPFEQMVLNTIPEGGEWSWRQKKRDYRIGRQVVRHLETLRPDVIYLSSFNTPDRLRVIRWAAEKKIPIIAWSDANLAGSPPAGGVRGRLKESVKHRYFRWIDGRVSAWLGCGSESAAYYTHYGIAPGRIDFAPPEPDYALIDEVTGDEAARVTSDMGLPADKRLIVCSGRLVPNKRFDRAIDAFVAVAEERPDWNLVIAGGGPLEIELRQRVPEALRKRVHFLGFVENPRDVACLYRRGDVLLHAAEHEPWALIVNEAAAASMALVCTHVVGAAVELIEQDANGKLVRSGDAPALAAALREVTLPDRLPMMQLASPKVLARWREKADPIEGLRRTLRRIV